MQTPISDSDRDILLEALLPLVTFTGWSDAALKQAEESTDLPKGSAERVFPSGATDALNWWLASCNQQILSYPSEITEFEKLRVPEKIEALIMHHFAKLYMQREQVRRGLATYGNPANTLQGLHFAAQTVDHLWRAAGDESLDYNYYTKRGLLSGVYMSSLRVWLNDDQPEMNETRAFLKRRLANVETAGKAIHKGKKAFKNLLSIAPASVRGAFTS